MVFGLKINLVTGDFGLVYEVYPNFVIGYAIVRIDWSHIFWVDWVK